MLFLKAANARWTTSKPVFIDFPTCYQEQEPYLRLQSLASMKESLSALIRKKDAQQRQLLSRKANSWERTGTCWVCSPMGI